MPHQYTYINKIWVGGDVKIAKNKTKQNKKTNSKNHLSTWEDPPEGKGYPLQYSGLESSMDCIVHGVTKSQTRLKTFTFLLALCIRCIMHHALCCNKKPQDI